MKKLFAALSTLVFAISLAMPVFAQETAGQETAPKPEVKAEKHKKHKKESKEVKKEAKKEAKEAKGAAKAEEAPPK